MALATMRLSVWDRTGSKRLETEDGFPAVSCPGAALATPAQIVEAARAQLGLDLSVLRVASLDLVEAEWLDARSASPPPGFRWREEALSPPSAARAPWERLGWLEETLEIVDAELARAGYRRTGAVEHMRQTSVTALLRIPTDREPVWLKALPEMFGHEATVVRWLSRFAPTSVPAVIAASDGLWISAEFPRESGDRRDDVLTALARLQIESCPRIDELLELGCPRRSLAALGEEAMRLSERADLLDDEERRALAAASPSVSAICESVLDLQLPETVVHGDLTPMNARWTDRGWFIYDWTDARVASPIADLGPPLSYGGAADSARRRQVFGEVWAEVVPFGTIEQALCAAPVVGAAHQIANYRYIVDGMQGCGNDQSSVAQMSGLLRYWSERLVTAVAEFR